jgi:hypothetical protein
MELMEKLDMYLNEAPSMYTMKANQYGLKVKDEKSAKKVLKKRGVKFVNKGLDFVIDDDQFDTAEEALLRANILRF